MFMVASSVVSTILILNYHHRNADTHEMSEWVINITICSHWTVLDRYSISSNFAKFSIVPFRFALYSYIGCHASCEWAGPRNRITRQKKRKRKHSNCKASSWKKGNRSQQQPVIFMCCYYNIIRRQIFIIKPMVSFFRSSKSLLANVLDIDDDFRCNHRCTTGTLPHQPTYYRTVYR